ncbi:hypothetical protein ABT136_34350, partial [Streptomyces sp. NPDC001856]
SGALTARHTACGGAVRRGAEHSAPAPAPPAPRRDQGAGHLGEDGSEKIVHDTVSARLEGTDEIMHVIAARCPTGAFR